MPRELPERPSLVHLKHQADDLLPDLQRSSPHAKLADALHAVAREYGFLTWPVLKAHVESVNAAVAAGHPFTGRWIADRSSIETDPATGVSRVTLDVAVEGDTVTIVQWTRDHQGQALRATNVVIADGTEQALTDDYSIIAQWSSQRTLDVRTKFQGDEIGIVTYVVARDGRTLSLAGTVAAHGGYEAATHSGTFMLDVGG